jgi:hypothetical protein
MNTLSRRLWAIVLMTVSLSACSQNSDVRDIPIENPRDLDNRGYVPVPSQPGLGGAQLPSAHSLAWPVTFQDASHVIGNTMAQYQPYDGAYWHGGADLRVKAGAAVRAPIAGRVEAGHYSYAIKSDGSMTKYWKAWPAQGNDTYFEVAVVADDGTRYEFHHVNRKTLPASTIALVESGGRANAGDTLGYTIAWSDGVYHHIHYNIVTPGGTRINPEYVSTIIPDTTAPEILSSYAVLSTGTAQNFGTGSFAAAPSEFAIEVRDRLGRNVYSNPPSWARLQFQSGAATTWDFRQTLTREDGTQPALWDFFVKTLRTPLGTSIGTTGGYGTGTSVIRLKVPTGATGPFRIDFADQAGNSTGLTGSIGP